jgi:hypothetical protein
MAKAKKKIDSTVIKELDNQEFIKIWKGDYRDNPKYSEFYLTGYFEKLGATFNFDRKWGDLEPIVVFKNHNIEHFIVLKDASIDKMPNLLIEDCTIKLFKISNSLLSKIVLKNTIVKYEFSLDDIDASDLSLETSNLKSISISNSTIDSLSIQKKSIISELSIKNSKLERCFIHKNVEIFEFYIYDTSIQYFKLWSQVEIKGCLNIGMNTAFKNLIIDDAIVAMSYFKNFSTEDFTIKNSRITSLEVNNSIVTKFIITASEIDSFSHSQLDLQYLNISEGSSLNHLHCKFGTLKPIQIFLNEINIEHLDFTQVIVSEFSTFHISNCKVLELSLVRFCNFGSIFFNGLLPKARIKVLKIVEDDKPMVKESKFSTKTEILGEDVINFLEENLEKDTVFDLSIDSSYFTIEDSDLGKIQFINCKLTHFDHFEFSNSKLLEVFIAGTQLPEQIETLEGRDLNEQKRLAFGQFKKIYETRGDTPMALRYLALEMKAYQALLCNEKIENYPITGSRRQNLSERFLLFWNQYSNNFGTSWLRGVFSTLIAASICYSIFCWSLGFTLGSNWDVFNELTSFAPQYLNPLRDVDSGPQVFKDSDLLINVKMNFWARLWDYFSRVIVAYFVFQTIQAFRKLGKTSS